MSYKAHVAAGIAGRLMSGESLTRVCADQGMPTEAAVRGWIKRRPEFAQVRSMPPAVRKMRAFADTLAQCVDVADVAQKTGLSKSRVLRRIQQCADAGIAVEYKATACPTCGAQIHARKGRAYCSGACKNRAERARRGATPIEQLSERAALRRRLVNMRGRMAQARRGILSARRLGGHTERLASLRERMRAAVVRSVGDDVGAALAIGGSAEENARLIALTAKGMNGAALWKLRYTHDPFFRQKEIQRLKRVKLRRKRACEDGITSRDAALAYRDSHACLYCGTHLSEGEKTLDHMDPLSRGGAHARYNLAVACSACNTRKAAKTFVAWVAMLGEPHKTRALEHYNGKRAGMGVAA